MLPSRSLLAELRISRLARVTDMDRAGVEVAAAIRPTGHVLQVTQGKGTTFEQAAWSAVGEAAELHAAEQPRPSMLRFCEAGELDGAVLDDDGLRRAWVVGRRLADGAPVWLAAERVFCGPSGSAWLGPSTTSWSSNGFGAHSVKGKATEHAVLEVWERHALTRVLPEGWTAEALERSLVEWRSPLVDSLRRNGFHVACCALQATPLPLAGALVFDLDEPSVPLTAGYACRRTMPEALEAALLEAAQSRLTEIHGARDDVATGEREAGAELQRFFSTLRPAPLRRGAAVKGWPKVIADAVVLVTVREAPLHVVKAIGIDLEESELLR
ncbi:MAG: fatty acid-binding protein [Archangiaceae bacterium]|nr:fatty acid-binding protein [Archangiaceae bacterium]